MKKLCSLLLCLILLVGVLPLGALTVSAETVSGVCGDNATFELDTETGVLEISGTGRMIYRTADFKAPWKEYLSVIRTVHINSGITKINSNAFLDCINLASITIPDSVTEISSYAFVNCSSLIGITIPDGVSEINSYTFSGCSSLQSVILGNGVTTIGSYAFEDCDNLTSITIPNSVTNIGTYSFQDCAKLTILCHSDSYAYTYANNKGIPTEEPPRRFFSGTCGENLDWSLDTETGVLDISGTGAMDDFEAAPWYDYCVSINTVNIANGVTSIGNYAFYDCCYLTSVTVPDSILRIGNAAFFYCDNLTSITIPDGVTTIGVDAFSDCGLTSITIPNSVTSIGDNAFLGCNALTGVYITDLTAWCGIVFGIGESNPLYHAHRLYLNGESVVCLVIPDDVTTIGANTFSGCTGLTGVIIPSSVTSIANSAFSGCSLTVYGDDDSEAERYALDNGHKFVTLPEKIKIFSKPDKLVYGIGEELDTEGLIIAVYLPSGLLEWRHKGFEVTGFDSDTTGTKTVTVNYLGQTASFTVTVEQDTVPQILTTDDMIRLMRELLGEEETVNSFDYNFDGTVDVRDLVCIKKILANG